MRMLNYPMIKIKFIGEIAYNQPSLCDAFEKLEERFDRAKSFKALNDLTNEMDRVDNLLKELECLK